jgi:hypothetical protein
VPCAICLRRYIPMVVCVCVADQPAAWQTGIRVWDAAGMQHIPGKSLAQSERMRGHPQPAALISSRAIHPHQGFLAMYISPRKYCIGDGSAMRLLATLLTHS